jgi:glycosyltransferase involved in cell wall biosynthesis
MIRDDVEGFAQAVTVLLADPSKREAMGEQARRVVRSHYDWSAIAPRLLDVYKGFRLG